MPPRPIPAAGSALRSHPCVAVPSARVRIAYQIRAVYDITERHRIDSACITAASSSTTP